MSINQKGFSFVEILIVVVALGLIGSTGWYIWQTKSKSANTISNVSDAQKVPDFTSHIDVGTHSLTLKTSDRILMPSGAVLSLSEQDVSSVPVFNYDNTYRATSHKQLAINSQLDVYHNGYRYKISKGTCNTEDKNFDDYNMRVVTDCTVTVDVQKSNLETLQPATIQKQYTVAEKNNPSNGPQAILNTDPFLLVRGGNGRLTYPLNNGKPYLSANDGPSVSLTIITDYGVSSISYDADEFTALKEKQVDIAGSTIKVKPLMPNCGPGPNENGKCATVYSVFVFDISYSRQAANNPEVVIYNLK